MEEDKEYVGLYLPKKLAKSLKELEGGITQEKLIKQFFQRSKDNMRFELEDLDESLIQYKGYMLATKQAFEKAKDEQLEAHVQLWEKFEKELPDIEEKTRILTDRLKPLENHLDRLNKRINNLNIYKLENAVELIAKINNMAPETKNIFKFLLENYHGQ